MNHGEGSPSLQQAALWHRQGDLDRAERAYWSWLDRNPSDPQALHPLGIIALQQRKPAAAEPLLRSAAQAEPDNPHLLRHWGDALSLLGRHDAAEAIYRKGVSLAPQDTILRLHWGNALRALGRFGEADAAYLELIRLAPGFHPALLQRGLVLSDQQRHAEARDSLLAARVHGNTSLELALGLIQAGLALGLLSEAEHEARSAAARFPEEARLLALWGDALRRLGRYDEAETVLRKATARSPAPLAAWHTLAKLHLDRGRAEVAEGIFRQLIQVAPQRSEVAHGLIVTLIALHRRAEAEQLARNLTQRDPSFASGWSTLSQLLVVRAPHEAAHAARQALDRSPQDADALAAASAAAHLLGHSAEALALIQRAAGPRIDHGQYASAYLFLASYTQSLSPQDNLQQAMAWSRSLRRSARPFADPSPGTAGVSLRIGYLSPDFREHAVSSFIEPVLQAHRSQGLEVHLYAQLATPDATTRRLQSLVPSDHWHVITPLDDQRAAELIRQHRLDVLVDLAGHTRENRLGIFAQRAAPVQATYLGYFGTTGLAEMDYWIGDEFLFPDPSALGYSEALWRLPRCWLCYQPPESSPPPAIHPDTTAIHFGSFNNLLKVSAQTLDLWAATLAAVPGSRLTLKARSLEEPAQGERLRRAFATRGIDPARLVLRPPDPSRLGHLAQYHDLDIALDTTPFTGGTTTAEALWMGVPVLTLCGQSMPSRMSSSMLRAVGLEEWIAVDATDFVHRAVRLAEAWRRLGPEQRLASRHALRATLLRSDLMNGPGLASALTAAYRAMRQRSQHLSP